jgi:hypothetical protein
MQTIFKTQLSIAMLILLFSCSEKKIEEQPDFTIKFGSECGWCGGQEYIVVSGTKVEYDRNIPCGENEGTINKSRNLSSEEWEEIYNSFSYTLFKTLQYTNCNVCADGCDEIIQITDNESAHELRYSFSDEVEGMENLRTILLEIMDEMQNEIN